MGSSEARNSVDDGNIVNGDGCSEFGIVEDGFFAKENRVSAINAWRYHLKTALNCVEQSYGELSLLSACPS